MRNRLVPRSEWSRFFEEFSRRYDGWLATVRVLHPSFGSQMAARDVPLSGIVSSADGSGLISLYLGGSTTKNVEHEIPSPRQVWVEMSEGGVEQALGILSEDDTKTILEFRSPTLPETVDGIVRPS